MKNEKGKVILLKRKEKKLSCSPIVLTVASARVCDRVVLKRRKENVSANTSYIINSSPKNLFVNSGSIVPRALSGFLALLLLVNPVAIVYAEVGEVETKTAAVSEEEVVETFFEETSNEIENSDVGSRSEVFSTNDTDLLATAIEEPDDDALDTETMESVEETVLDSEETSDTGDEENIGTDDEEGVETDQTQDEELLEDEPVVSDGQDEETEEVGEEEDTQTEVLPEETEDEPNDIDEDSDVDETEDEDQEETEGSGGNFDDEEEEVEESLPDAREDEEVTDDDETTSTTNDVEDETDDEDDSIQTDDLPAGLPAQAGGGDTNDGSTEEVEDQEEDDSGEGSSSGGEGNETEDEDESDLSTDEEETSDSDSLTDGDENDPEGENDNTEDENSDDNSSGEEENETQENDAPANDQNISQEETAEKVVDEVLLRAEIEKVVEERIKKEYEEKMQKLLAEQQESAPEEIQNFQSNHSFKDAECEVLSDDEIYCRRGEVLFDGDETAGVFTGVFSQDGGNDSEIIFQHGGQVKQITDNSYSDINPVYDEKSDKIVWQALIDGRWQIMVHDLTKSVTEQISGGGFNNINPHIAGGIVVWQGWVGSNWDIFYARYITLPDQTRSWSTMQITDNTWSDVDPSVVDGVVLWEALIADSWQVFSYEITTDKLVQVSQGKGDNRNPRLVVLWDSVEDGVAQTIQYDVSTNERSVVGTDPVRNEDPFSHTPESPIDENQAAMPVSSGTASSSRPDGEDPLDE